METKFSVLMSVYKNDKADQLKLALESIYNEQTLKPNEIVLVFDGPVGQELEQTVEEFEKTCPVLKVVKQPENLGLGKTLNNGLTYCTNELVARMDSDDISMPTRFEKQIAVVQNGDYDIVGTNISEFCDDPNNIVSVRVVPEKQEDIVKFMKSRTPFSHVTVMFKKSMVEKAGGYQHLYYCEDYYLWVRMYLAGAKMYNIQENLVNVRMNMEAFGRRGGIKYYKSHKTLFKFMRKNKVVGFGTYLKNCLIRFTAEVLMTNNMRKKFYIKHLRKTKELRNNGAGKN